MKLQELCFIEMKITSIAFVDPLEVLISLGIVHIHDTWKEHIVGVV